MLLVSPFFLSGCAMLDRSPQRIDGARLLYRESFERARARWRWTVGPGGEVGYDREAGCLDVLAPEGATVWFETELVAPLRIEFEVEVLDLEGEGRTDLSFFAPARDPASPNDPPFAPRDPRALEHFGDLRSYFLGYGMADNKVTRFARLAGGDRTADVLGQKRHELYLLEPGPRYRFALVIHPPRVAVYRNRTLLFEDVDPEALSRGWFGIHFGGMHARLNDVQIYRLPPLKK
ncbi:DUF6250 domain-containing protein [Kiritimatiella glycovorans]|nr:DUF6250 domain-containing protein [Kiritimatiella glycovorans]